AVVLLTSVILFKAQHRRQMSSKEVHAEILNAAVEMVAIKGRPIRGLSIKENRLSKEKANSNIPKQSLMQIQNKGQVASVINVA
ncbi:hypothetical protein PIB30_114942, partial [Stylosanthes scabra]|nr:hypothetical protein [Stylosanthes scabra]